MAGTLRSNIYFCLLLFWASLLPWSSQSSNDVALFIFGDSLYDAGNTRYMKEAPHFANFLPYGDTFFKHPTGRACDGRLIPDFIAEYANLTLIPPYLQLFESEVEADAFVEAYDQELTISLKTQSYLQPDSHINGANFALCGAGALVETHRGAVIDLQTQLSYFKNVEKQLRHNLGDAKAKKLLSEAVYIFSIGGNDYFAALTKNVCAREEYDGMVIGNITTVIQGIHEKGGLKFGMSTLIPLGCLPSFRAVKYARAGGLGCLDEATLYAKLHNRELSKALIELGRQLQEFTYSIFDAYTAGSERFNDPSKYGFKNVEEACCGSDLFESFGVCGQKDYKLCDNVSEYFFFDLAHPTEMANSQFAQLMWTGSSDIVKPCNLKTLFEK